MCKREHPAQRGLPIIVAAVILFVAGCGGPKKYPVDGTVVYEEDGKPVKNVMVVTEPKDPEAPRMTARGITNDEGYFVLGTELEGDGVVEGLQMVLVNPPPRPEETDRNVLPPIIDSKFRRFHTSGLEFTVNREKNTWNIKVHKPRPRELGQ